MGFLTTGIYHLFDYGLLQWLFDRNGITQEQTSFAVLVGVGLLVCVLLSYLLVSVNFALVVSKLLFHDDVRQHGSGNAGATNITRTYGKKAGVLTFLGDGLKGVVAIVIACALFGGLYPHLITAAYLSAFICIVGHVFPIFAHFHGGNGFATTAMCIIVLNPFVALILLAIFMILVLGTKYISLGSVVTALFYPIFLSMFDQLQVPPYGPYGINVLFAFLIAALVTWAHRGNLKRIREGTERRMGDKKKAVTQTVAAEPEEDTDEVDATESHADETSHRPQPKSKKNQKKLKKGKK
ncbi:MAG: glycerol-3-phosphate 1-O-acyltransferase PlsY [Clostridia bacterium]|nr:glycerol-3-phosphate 1-O-acyltransferase PlsY [Clostridia bacterium]